MAAEPGFVGSGPLASPLVLRRPHGDVWSRRRPTGQEPGPPRVWSPGGSSGRRPCSSPRVVERAGACGVTAHAGLLSAVARPPLPTAGAAVSALAVPSARKPQGAAGASLPCQD